MAPRTRTSLAVASVRTIRPLLPSRALFQQRWSTSDSLGRGPVGADHADATESQEEARAYVEADEAHDGEGEAYSKSSAAAPAPGAENTGGAAFADAAYRDTRSGEFDSRSPHNTTFFAKKPTLYVGNLFFDVTEGDLVKEFARFGTVTRCKIVRDPRGLSKGFGYVDFSTQEAADQALERLNTQMFEGRRVTVQYAARSLPHAGQFTSEPKFPRNPPSKTLFIGNMSFEMTDRDLSNLFRGIRNVTDVRVAIDRRTGQPRGFAHADFVDVKSAMEASKALSEKEIYGRRLRVDYSYSSANRSPRNEPPSDDDASTTSQ